MTWDYNNWGDRTDKTPSEPSESAFTPGDEVWTVPPGFTSSSWGNRDDKKVGIGAYGAIGAEGEIRLVYNDYIIATQGPGDHYYLAGIPVGALQGQSYPDRSGDHFVEMKTESGGVASEPITSTAGATHFSPSFGTLTIGIFDANGDPVGKSKVGVGTTTHSTDSEGRVEVEAGGTLTVSALFGSVSRDVTLSAGNPKSLTFEYHGVEGQVRTPTGGPIGGATVYIALSDGTVLSKDTTDEDGTYELPIAPVGTEMKVASDPFVREFTTGVQGDYTTKNLPFNLEGVGAIELDFTDSESGEPIAGLPTTMKDAIFSALSTSEGEAALIDALGSSGAEKEVEVTIGENDPRYRTKTITATLIAGDTVTATVNIERETAVVNT